MVEGILTPDYTGIEIKNEEATSTSPNIFGGSYIWPSLSYGDSALRLDNLRGHILKWLEKKLNLDDDEQYRKYFDNNDKFKDSLADIQKEITNTIYNQGYLWISETHPAWEQRIEHLRQLPTNWDNFGASRVSSKALRKSESILTVMSYFGFSQHFLIAPTSDGGIQIEFDLPDKELLLEISPNGKSLKYLLVEISASGEELETEGTIPNNKGLEQLIHIIGV